MKRIVSALVVFSLLFPVVRDSRANQPVLLWSREIDVDHAEMAKNASIIVGSGFENGQRYFAINGANGEILWEYDAPVTIYWIRISDDGGVSSASGWHPCPPDDPGCLEGIWYEDWGDFETYVRRPDGSLIWQVNGGAALLSPDGTHIYIHGIPIQEDPENDIWRYKHGLFTTAGVEKWSHILEPVGMIQDSRFIGITNGGRTVLRECGFKINGTRPPECTPDGDLTRWLIDGITGNTLWIKKKGSGFASLSWDGNYILTTAEFGTDNGGKRLHILNRAGEIVLEKIFDELLNYARMSKDNLRIAVATDNFLHWMDFNGNILWSASVPGLGGPEWYKQGEPMDEPGSHIQISDDKKAITVLGSGVRILNAETGQVVASFPWPTYRYGVMTNDHTKLMLVRREPTKAIELWDISPLFQ